MALSEAASPYETEGKNRHIKVKNRTVGKSESRKVEFGVEFDHLLTNR